MEIIAHTPWRETSKSMIIDYKEVIRLFKPKKGLICVEQNQINKKLRVRVTIELNHFIIKPEVLWTKKNVM